MELHFIWLLLLKSSKLILRKQQTFDWSLSTWPIRYKPARIKQTYHAKDILIIVMASIQRNLHQFQVFTIAARPRWAYYTLVMLRKRCVLFPQGATLYTQFCRTEGCGGAGCPPPPIIFERLKLPQQIIYRRKGNLSESLNHLKYLENSLISRFYEQFSRSSRNLGHFWKFEKISNS